MPAKRRRERDRPKAAPDLGYNPNKRVLLSYSDDEDADVEDGEYGPETESNTITSAQRPQLEEDDLANYQIPTYREDEEDEEYNDGETTTSAGQYNAGADREVEDRGALKHGQQDTRRRKKHQTLGRNKSTNQKPALGSMAFQYDDDDDVDSGSDGYDTETQGAMAYLKSVRAERQTLPTVLFAARAEEHDEVRYDDGYVSEDAYIGRSKTNVVPTALSESVDAREAFDSILKQRFLRQRTMLQSGITVDAQNTETGSDKSTAQWMRTMRERPPSAAQLQCLDEDLVFRLMSILQRRLLRHDRNISPATSCWAWALLAKLEDVGTMNNDQVSTVREFGKKAVLVLTCLTAPATAEQLGAIDDSSEDEDDEGLPAKTPSSTGAVVDAAGKEATTAALDSIITLVGDVFGQRDLLECRRPWIPAE